VGETQRVIRLVATDLDGTFWTSEMVVPERHVKAVRELASRGVTVLVATSRRPRVVRAALANAGLSLPAVVLDGAIGIDFRTGQRFHEAVFEPMVAAATLDAFRSAHLDPCIYIEDPDVDIVLSDSPATCRAHLRDIWSVSGVVDLDTVVRSFYRLGPRMAARSESARSTLTPLTFVAFDLLWLDGDSDPCAVLGAAGRVGVAEVDRTGLVHRVLVCRRWC